MSGLINILYAALAGTVQGVTEWLPISSTGHLLFLGGLFSDRLDRAVFTDGFTALFDVVIQLASVFAVIAIYFARLNPFSKKKLPEERKETLRLWKNVALASVPVALAGALLDDFLSKRVFRGEYTACIVAAALFVYGVLFIIVDKRGKGRLYRVTSAEAIDKKTALGVGAFQILALIPGTSRSGSTILGASLLGVSRGAAAEFSFFLAIPVMAGASGLKLVRYLSDGMTLNHEQTAALAVGMMTSFAVSLAAVKFLTDFVKRRGIAPFGYYRIILSAVVAASSLIKF